MTTHGTAKQERVLPERAPDGEAIIRQAIGEARAGKLPPVKAWAAVARGAALVDTATCDPGLGDLILEAMADGLL